MNVSCGIKTAFLGVVAFCIISANTFSQNVPTSLFNCMKWRMIGPYRGGRTVGGSGIASQPNVFYMGVNNGGVWKTNDFGRTWNPVFDDQSTGSIGDVAVAPSNPNVIYVGSGEGLQRPDLSTGNGMYRSSDGGKTWIHLGLEKVWQIGGLAIDPRNENKVFAAALGHPYGPNPERGIYRSTDGGKNWSRVLYADENTGAVQVQIDPQNSEIVYADMWAARQAPWENGSWEGEGSGLFKSSDGGTTWKHIGKGLPGKAQGLGRIGFCIAPSTPSRLYALVNATEGGGAYRSDDGGESWTILSTDPRLWDRGDDFAEIRVDPKNPDVVYDANVVVWKSTDAGKHWSGFKGAPGGDDYHRLWINPDHTEIMLLCGDQGAITTVNGGATWSSWYNQPTAQLYHVSADNAFPYNVYSGQQESGSVGISSRGNDGFISAREWHPVGAEEYGYVVADPLDPNMIYGGKISRYNKLTGQTQDISPAPSRSGKYRFLRTAPIVFSPRDPHTLYYAGNVVLKTRNGGNSWEVISPDLTRTSYDLPSCIGVYSKESMKTMRRRGVVYTLAPSPLDVNVLWAGTDDGLIQLTRDGGKNWADVSPPQLGSWNKVSLMEASHSDVNTAYAAVNCIRLDDERPHIYRTTDAGKTWKEITNGLPAGPINVVKEDPERKGLLFAGSETQVFVSFDNGELWQSLRLNMPPSSVRDLVIKNNDLIAATHGRSFWILDDMTALRQVNAGLKDKRVVLYKPAPAYRVRWSMNADTPYPADEPAAQNPPDGAILDYYLKENAKADLLLEVADSGGVVIRRFSSIDKAPAIPDVNIPLYWIRPTQTLSADSGSHRFVWDLHEQPLEVPPSFPSAAVTGETPPASTSPWVMPGHYTLRLTCNGKTESQQLEVLMDPRVKATPAALRQQHDMSDQCYRNTKQVLTVLHSMDSLRDEIQKHKPAAGSKKTKLDSLSAKLMALRNGSRKEEELSFMALKEMNETIFNSLQAADTMPTTQLTESVIELKTEFSNAFLKWVLLKEEAKEILKK
jgi:photosystem II stability/assembly factor-like uncharacterized protein